jgi:hypothetical protein
MNRPEREVGQHLVMLHMDSAVQKLDVFELPLKELPGPSLPNFSSPLTQ